MDEEPAVQLQRQFSSEGASAVPWSEARRTVSAAQIWWLSTVRPDGRPHVTPLLAVWQEGALYFCTGPGERKALNLEDNRHCVLTTGCNLLHEGLDIVVEGDVVQVTDDDRLRSLAEAYESKYGPDWHFDVAEGMFRHEGGQAMVFEVRPATAFGFGRGEVFSATRWRF